jgi:hypothetical protein
MVERQLKFGGTHLDGLDRVLDLENAALWGEGRNRVVVLALSKEHG